MKIATWCLMVGLVLTTTGHAQQANPPPGEEFSLSNRDKAKIGLNDETVVSPVGGNPGTTLGEQRRIAYQFAMDLWSVVLRSPVTVHVQASFAALQCDGDKDHPDGKNILGHAKAINNFYAPHGFPKVSYQGPLANAIEKKDLDPKKDEIFSEFNGAMGVKDCMPGDSWYLGLDGKSPAKQTNFVNVVMHEIGHGLGFAGNEDKGGDIYSHFAYDNVSNKFWDAMTAKGRAAAQINQNAVFRGINVQAEAPLVLGPKMVLRLSGAIQKDLEQFGVAEFGPRVLPGAFMGSLAMVNDGAGLDHADACEALVAGSLTGRVAFINRGNCAFDIKLKNVQDAGAIAAIVGNVATSADPEATNGMGLSTGPDVNPNLFALQINLEAANLIRNAPAGDITAQATNIPNRYQGADENGYPYLYAPLKYNSGSTFSHFDTRASPNLIMEPFSNVDQAAHVNLDLTPALLADEGWTLNRGNGMIDACDTGIKAFAPGGKIIGANVQAYARTCLRAAVGSRSRYLRCMTDHAQELKSANLIDVKQMARIRTCAAQVAP